MAQQFLLYPQIPDLPTIKRGWDNQMQMVASNPMEAINTISCLHIAWDRERRISVPAPLGWKFVDYGLQIQVCHTMDSNSGDEVADAVDGLIEDIKVRLRSDPRMGQPPTAIFESAQGPAPDIEVVCGDTNYLNTGLANGTPVTWFTVSWTATEQVQG